METDIMRHADGYFESNPIEFSEQHRPDYDSDVGARSVSWNDKRLRQITRLRLLSDPGFPLWDLSYCWGVLRDGTKVDVRLPFDQLPRKGMRRAIVEAARHDGVYAKGLNLFDAISVLT
jgi:hypothetical protein